MAKKGIAEAATRAGLAADSAKKPARPRKTASKRPSTGRKPEPPLLPASWIERRILLVRGEKVMIDSYLAELYEVETRALVQAVKRNIDRFPQDFMFRLSASEAALLT